MKAEFKKIFNDKFLKNVVTLTFGTIISQVFVIAASPLLSRVYSVESFGNLAVFTSFTSFLAVVSTGRYELTLGLPEKEESSLKIFKLILYIGLIVSIIYFIGIVLFKNIIVVTDKTGFLNQSEAYLSPVYIYNIAIFSALSYWKQRKKQYKIITIANIIQVVSSTSLSLIFGFFDLQGGLIWSLCFGIFASTIYYFTTEIGLLKKVFKQTGLKAIAKEYIAFPKYMIFSDLSTVASQQFIPIIFSILYSTTVVGFFSMANRIVRIPNIIITNAISNVFRNDAIDEIRVIGNCERLYINTFKKLIFISFPVYLSIFLFAPILFEFILGEQWSVAGDYARIISVFLFVEFVSSPFNSLFNIRGKQKKLMNYQLMNAIFGCMMIYIGFRFFSSTYMSLVLFSLNAVIFNIVLLFYSYRIAKNNNLEHQ